jgi:hypothetical protein
MPLTNVTGADDRQHLGMPKCTGDWNHWLLLRHAGTGADQGNTRGWLTMAVQETVQVAVQEARKQAVQDAPVQSPQVQLLTVHCKVVYL